MKKLLKSKTFWTGVITVLFGVSQIANNMQDQGIQTILMGAAIIFGRNAINKVGV